MKKHFIAIPVLLLTVSLSIFGCGKNEEAESVTASEIVVEEAVTEEPVSEIPGIEETVIEEPAEDVSEDDMPEFPYWWDLYDYNLDQEVLAQDGEFKNLTLQPGNKPDELYVTWFSKSSSRGKVIFETDGFFSNITAKATTQGSVSVPNYYRNSALITG